MLRSQPTTSAVFLFVTLGPLSGIAAQQRTLWPDDRLVGTLTEGEAVVETEGLAALWASEPQRGVTHRLDVGEPGLYHVALRSRFFDAYLVLRDGSGAVLAEADGGWIGHHARLAFEVDEASGERLVTVCAADGRTGEYELEFLAGPPEELAPEELRTAQLAELRAVVELRTDVLGAEHPDTAGALQDLAYELKRQNQLVEARELYERALAIREGMLGDEHPLTAATLHSLSTLLYAQGLFDEARSSATRALTIREEALGPEHPKTARTINNLAAILEAQGDLYGARPLHERALAILERDYGPDHPAVANSLSNLAVVLENLGELDAALPLLERSVSIYAATFGEEHAETAYRRNNLATVHYRLGRYDQARPLFERALTGLEAGLGVAHPITSQCLGNLAQVLFEQGNDEDALPMTERVIATLERTLGPEHPEVAVFLNNQATVFVRQGRVEEALPIFERALAICEQSLGADHHRSAWQLSSLGALHERLGRLDDAWTATERARVIQEATFGREHPVVARSLSNLARIHRLRGDLDESLELAQRSVAMVEAALGPEHPETASLSNRLVYVLLDVGRLGEAWSQSQRGVEARLAHRRQLAWSLSEFERLELAKDQAVDLDTLLAVARLVDESGGDEVGRSAYETVLRWKGEVGRSLLRTRGAVLGTLDADDRARVDELQRLQAQLSRAVYEPGDPVTQRARIASLRDERDRLERELSRSFGAAEDEAPSPTVAALAGALPPGSASVDFLVHEAYEPAARGEDGSFEPGSATAAIVSAWIVRAGSERPIRVELGDAASLESATRTFLETLTARRRGRLARDVGLSLAVPSRAAVDEVSRALSERLWKPLARHLDDVDRLFVSPDAFLGALPLEVLQEPDGRYLLERFGFVYLTDLVRLRAHEKDAGERDWSSLVCLGDVDYGGGSSERWRPLPATKIEAEAVAALHAETFGSSPSLLRRAETTEARVKRELPRHRVLHLATHGFFRSGSTLSSWRPTRGETRALVYGEGGREVAVQLPGLLSGLVLAGANRATAEGEGDGYLTAEEISFLDLSHVELVVLSACETGLGHAQGGDGMLGLRHSFRQAGAKAVIGSLWSVEDEATSALMRSFYDRLWRRGESKLEALRGARLELLEQNRAEHDGDGLPSTWGAFVLDGDGS